MSPFAAAFPTASPSLAAFRTGSCASPKTCVSTSMQTFHVNGCEQHNTGIAEFAEKGLLLRCAEQRLYSVQLYENTSYNCAAFATAPALPSLTRSLICALSFGSSTAMSCHDLLDSTRMFMLTRSTWGGPACST